ncbi:hypothetical protein Tco_0676101 [Tanacetum coccineum]
MCLMLPDHFVQEDSFVLMGSNSSNPHSPAIDFIRDDLGHHQGFNGFASENERASTSDSVMFEGDVADIHDIEHIQSVINQHVRMSERSFVFPNKYTEYVIDFIVIYGFERYVGNANFNSKNDCFTTELNKAFEQKTYWQACKEHHWIEVMNKEMTALYDNDTWDITDLLSDRQAIGSK